MSSCGTAPSSPVSPLSSNGTEDGNKRTSSTPAAPRRLSGALLKQRDHVKSWRPRYFVLDREDGLLLYYLPKADPRVCPPRGALPLAGCSMHRVDDTGGSGRSRSYGFVLVHPWMRPWHLAASSSRERDMWTQSLGQLLDSPDTDPLTAMVESPGISAPQHGDRDLLVVPELASRFEEVIRTLLEMGVGDDGWVRTFERRGVTAYKRPGQYVTLRGVGVIPQHPISILLAILDVQLSIKLDPQLNLKKRIRIDTHHLHSDYLSFKGIWPVAPRDMYLHVHWRVLDDGTIVVACFSEDAHLHPTESGVVRADCRVGGWVIKPVDAAGTAALCTYMNMIDLKGDIPKAIVDKATESQPLLISAIRDTLAKDSEGGYSVDRERLRGGYSAKDVYPHMRRLHRRSCNEWRQHAPWLLDSDERTGPAPASTTTSLQQHQQHHQQQQAPVVTGHLGGQVTFAHAVVALLLVAFTVLTTCLLVNVDGFPGSAW